MPTPTLRERAALSLVRTTFAGLAVVGVLGFVGAILAYRADVSVARTQVHRRVAQQGELYAESLSRYFELVRVELQRVGDRPVEELRARAPSVLAEITGDRSLVAGGVSLLSPDGSLLWHDGAQLLPDSKAAWFQRLLAGASTVVDAQLGSGPPAFVIGLAVRREGRLDAVLVGLVPASDRLLYGAEAPETQLLVLSSERAVALPLRPPDWVGSPRFATHLAESTAEAGTSWEWGGQDYFAHAFAVPGTSLEALAVEAESAVVQPIERRLVAQLLFLLLLQLGTLGGFALLLRRTYRAFAEVELRIARQETMAALGAAASLIAHEVKNSLNGLKAAVALLEAGGDGTLVTKTVRGQVDRLAHLARSLLSFARPDEAQRVPVSLDALVREVVDGLRPLPEFEETELTLSLAAAAQTQTDPLLLMTALDNVLRNAMEAAVAAKDTGAIAQARVAVALAATARGFEISVQDNAGGPSPGFERHWGEPFVTTKPKGVGLGLAMARRAMERLGGGLEFQRAGDGARFTLTLPGPQAALPPQGAVG